MVSDVTKLQEVAISQLFLPDDTPERKSRGNVFGDGVAGEAARRDEDRATVLSSPESPRPCPSAAGWPEFAQLPDGDARGSASCSRWPCGRQCLHLDTCVGGCGGPRPGACGTWQLPRPRFLQRPWETRMEARGRRCRVPKWADLRALSLSSGTPAGLRSSPRCHLCCSRRGTRGRRQPRGSNGDGDRRARGSARCGHGKFRGDGERGLGAKDELCEFRLLLGVRAAGPRSELHRCPPCPAPRPRAPGAGAAAHPLPGTSSVLAVSGDRPPGQGLTRAFPGVSGRPCSVL